ncbi:MAG: SUMF1/EgtB/PvdO family nonheme iron enzyme [Nitrospinaceae bacterium]|nr:formylglycine-generating enzyme family protein [Nitrospinaceae bacterium]NIR53561.1 formylglycine-generating enzyme family protein [Nitrospinaceae bacterium]NIS83962.1 formylglycine-generating enzyme family protein [Nitrospinaceae bacterium]NIT80771.1 formylglycine-generating enzyme family protein [Nitrospinaceae bacterium]NIU43077.1 formylglycine-generating enzyme family protein [Nitrospinaceae bacterium]
MFALILFSEWPTGSQASPSGSEMITIPAGEFVMGSTEKDILWAAKTFFSESLEYYQDETPSHTVRLETFKIDKTEVTMGQYRAYMKQNGKPAPKFMDNERFNGNDQPVVGVTWQEAVDYCSAQGKRLPTEAEWEKAARGSEPRYYPWGNEPDKGRANAAGKKMDGYVYTAPVGMQKFSASPYGVRDMAGNVWEWTSDWYQPYPGNGYPNPNYGVQFKVIRGGSWFSNIDLARVTVRGKSFPDKRYHYLGFRCAQSS